MAHIWMRLDMEPIEWRKIYKALYLLDIILRSGDPDCVAEIKSNSYKIKMLQGFSYRDEGIEKGNGIREKASNIEELLNNPELLEEEREKAKSVRGKISGGSPGSSGQYCIIYLVIFVQ